MTDMTMHGAYRTHRKWLIHLGRKRIDTQNGIFSFKCINSQSVDIHNVSLLSPIKITSPTFKIRRYTLFIFTFIINKHNTIGFYWVFCAKRFIVRWCWKPTWLSCKNKLLLERLINQLFQIWLVFNYYWPT